MSNEIKLCLCFSLMLPNHSITFCVFFHWFKFKLKYWIVTMELKFVNRWANFSWKCPYLPKCIKAQQFREDYMKQAPQKTRRNRQRNIIWFNPPFSKNVKTNIARNFLCLIDKHFPPNHKLHKIFNRNTVKVSYSCMNNVKSIISKHNTRITGKSKPQCEVIDPCTCRDKKTCPLQEKCMTKDIVYKATITTSNTYSTKHYIGMTASTFKERYRNHIKSFIHKSYSNDTELSKYIWKLKDNKQDFDITWSVLKQSISYTGGSKRCNLCLEENLCILKDKNIQNLLNKKSEIFSTCNHRKKHALNKQSKPHAHVSDRKYLSSSFFEICQPPDDSSRMKQAVVATFLR